jgi:hypothetical protein
MTGLPTSARVLTLSYRAGHHVGFTLRAALNAALAEGRLPPLAPRDDEEINERVAALHTKRACMPILAGRVRRGWEPARAAALARDPADDAYGLVIAGGVSLGWGFVADVESLLTSLHSTLAVAIGLVRVVERRVLRLPSAGQTPELQLRALPGIRKAEQELFRDARDGFVHNYSAWLSVVIDGSETDLAILTRGRANFDTGEGYVLLSRIDAVLQALVQHIDALEASLAERVDQLGR